QEILRRYARLVIEVQLKLQRGDALSINTENSTMSFARMLATMACESTLQTVTIVETSHGKVAQVVEFDPVEKRIKRPPVTGYVMCHLFDLDSAPYVTDDNVSSLTEEVGKLGSFGLLSDPVFLDRRIAVPWANIPLPGPLWAMQLLGKAASEEDMWTLFAKIYRLEDNHGLKFWHDQANLLHYRKQKLTNKGKLSLTIEADDCNLHAILADKTQWTGGLSSVSSGRTFMPSLPMQHIHASLDTRMTEGTVGTTIPFLLLGKVVEDATFTFEKGKVVSYSANQGKEALDAFFAVDEGASVVSGISLADNDTIESRYLTQAIHPHFNREITCSLVLGGFNLNTLTDQSTDEEIDASQLGRSLVRLEIPIGSNSLTIQATDEQGNTTILLEDGVFEL
ncbi:MAG TPA: aminopeptidase, partial [Sphaerochaeta sp.]|nr:aminopeptidase [Sphaerochaeta sp.]